MNNEFLGLVIFLVFLFAFLLGVFTSVYWVFPESEWGVGDRTDTIGQICHRTKPSFTFETTLECYKVNPGTEKTVLDAIK